MEDQENSKNLEGLGGWLILVGIGVTLAPFILLISSFINVRPIFAEGIWELLTSPSSDLYHPMWSWLIIGEIIINSVIVILGCYLIFLFFSKKKNFPKFFIGIAIFYLIFIIADAFAIKLVLPDEPIFDPETMRSVARAIVNVAIWVPYMRLSKRVKATFIR